MVRAAAAASASSVCKLGYKGMRPHFGTTVVLRRENILRVGVFLAYLITTS